MCLFLRCPPGVRLVTTAVSGGGCGTTSRITPHTSHYPLRITHQSDPTAVPQIRVGASEVYCTERAYGVASGRGILEVPKQCGRQLPTLRSLLCGLVDQSAVGAVLPVRCVWNEPCRS